MQLTPEPKQAIWGFSCRVSCDLHELVLWPMFPRVGGWLTFFLIDAPSAFYTAFSFQVKGIPPATKSFLPKKTFPNFRLLCKRRDMCCTFYPGTSWPLTPNSASAGLLDPSSPSMHKMWAILATSLFHTFYFSFSILLLYINVFNLMVVTFYQYFLIFDFFQMFFALNHRFWIVMRQV